MAIKTSNQITFTEHKKIIEIKEYYLATSQSTGVTTETAGWTTDIQTIDYSNKYLWNYEEVVYSIGSSDISEPVIMGFYGKGDTGRGIKNIVNYYQVTQNLVAPELPDANNTSSWSDISVVTTLSPTNKYLWNYEAIVYTDGSVTPTDPAVIGVYGDSGANAVTFEIYSVHGFMFKEDLKSIELKIAAFEGSDAITGATYTWAWWDDTLNNGSGGYSVIANNIADPNFTVNEADEYAFANLKCTMFYNGNTYEDYITLTSETVIYTSVVKFFDGSNIFHSDDLYIVAYVDLYQNNHKIETIFADTYCTGVSSVSTSGVITANLSGSFSNGDRMYFVCKKNNLYEVVLGQYTSGIWKTIDVEMKYTYTNSLYPSVYSNVIAISKESVNKSQNIDFTILKDGAYVSSTNTNIIDSNDPIISNSTPENPVYGQLWLDTSVTPHVLKMYVKVDGKEAGMWTECTEKLGGAVFTSKPTSYAVGDLWILAKGEICGSFEAGSMLKATQNSTTFNSSHWIDADSESTELKNNIRQYLNFDPNTGLRIGQTDENNKNKFYVNISSEEMGFYDNSNEQHQKVVKISNNSALIKNAKFKGNTDFYGQINICDPSSDPEDNTEDALFIWKIEQNKSLSLAIAN